MKPKGIAIVLLELGRLAKAQGEFGGSAAPLPESLWDRKEAGDQIGIASTLLIVEY